MIQTKQELLRAMRSIDHRGYPAYKSLRGSYDFGSYVLHIVHVQGDPFAAPSDLKVTVRADRAGWPAADCGRYENRVALQDMILRRFGRKLDDVSGRARGSGKSGRLSASRPGQEILDRSACQISAKGDVTLRFFAGFPAAGRTVLAGELEKMLFDYLPGCVESSAVFSAYPEEAVRRVTDLAEDQAFLREELKRRNLCAFVADGAVLPRESGISQRPLRDSVPFRSPNEDRVTIGLPHRGDVTGMGIRRGVTLIIGGGYHGKSTLLKALERGVYNHIAGDGRELVVTDESAVKVRAEDGRCVSRDDISLFINHLPNEKDTRDFSTENASGSTSQAAAVVEALECGAKTLLMDEDTCATNFMVRDERMQRIVSAEEEPITPFSGRMRALFTQAGVSTILVAGSSGEFFGEADTVIQMDRYEPKDVTVRVRELAPAAGREKTVLRMPDARNRCPRPGRDFEEYKGRVKHKNLGKEGFVIGRGETDLRLVEQLVDGEQSECLAETFVLMAQSRMNGHNSVASLVGDWERSFEREGFGLYEKAGSSVSGNMAKPRKEELAAALNRCRGLLW